MNQSDFLFINRKLIHNLLLSNILNLLTMKIFQLLLLLFPMGLFAQTIEFSIEPENKDIVIDSVIFTDPSTGVTFKTEGATQFSIEASATMLQGNDFSPAFRIYPNPVAEKLTIEFNSDNLPIKNIAIGNIHGQVIYQSSNLSSDNITLHHLVNGLYVIHLNTASGNACKPFVVSGNTSNQEVQLSLHSTHHSVVLKSLNSAILLPFPWKVDLNLIMDINSHVLSSPYIPLRTMYTVAPKVDEPKRTYTFITHPCTDDSGKYYSIVEIGDQVWMAENLAMPTLSGSWVYDSLAVNAEKYGMLYDWQTAKEVCPDGWHLPSEVEWDQLSTYLSNLTEDTLTADCLKNPKEWLQTVQKVPNVGFNALPAGAFYPYTNSFYNQYSTAYFWTDTERPDSRTSYSLKLEYYRLNMMAELKLYKSEYINTGREYYYASSEFLNSEKLDTFSLEELSKMRNEIDAAHGYKFKVYKWQKYFTEKEWYKPRLDNVDQFLSLIEKRNIEIILTLEENKSTL